MFSLVFIGIMNIFIDGIPDYLAGKNESETKVKLLAGGGLYLATEARGF